MKLNDIDFNKLSDNELKALCIKYKMVESQNISNISRKESLDLIKKFLERKLKVYGKVKQKCSECNNLITSIIIGGRSTFFCNTCQK